MLAGNVVVRAFDFRELARVLEVEDEHECRASLSLVEQEVRRRLDPTASGDHKWFAELARVLMNSSRYSAAEPRVQILILIGNWYSAAANNAMPLVLAEKALEIASRANAHSLERKALNYLGTLHLAAMNITEATTCYVRGIEIAERLGDRIGRCAMLANLATARQAAGLLHEAITLNRYVLELTGDDLVLQPVKSDAYHNIATALWTLDDLRSALEYMESAVRLRSEPRDHHALVQQVILELNYTKLLVSFGHLDKARQRSALAMTYANKAGSRNAQVCAEFATTLCEAAEGKTDLALTRLRKFELEMCPGDVWFGDLLETELFCNKAAGRQQFAKYYRTKYLSKLAEWQRSTAIRQVVAVKRMLSRSPVAETELALLPAEVVASLTTNEDDRSDPIQGQLEALALLAELREDAAGEHSLRVGRLAALLALSLGYEEKRAKALELASRLHDIGKLAIPDVILLKRGKLNAVESKIMQRHTTEGCMILTDLVSAVESTFPGRRLHIGPTLRLAAEIALHHHEWWDGSGYPRGISGRAIPEEARIVALADVFDEITHVRPYKNGCSVDESLAQIASLSNRQFEPRLCAEFLKVARNLTLSGEIAGMPSEAAHPFIAANRVIQRIVRSVGLKSPNYT